MIENAAQYDDNNESMYIELHSLRARCCEELLAIPYARGLKSSN